MLHPRRPYWLALSLLLPLLGGCGADSAADSGLEVLEILDGDTIVVANGNGDLRVRLAQIDAPEKDQDYGLQSKLSLTELLRGKKVDLVAETKDRYGRLVAEVWVDGTDINAEQIKRGAAWVYVKYAHDTRLFDYEHDARANKLGLWQSSDPLPPWEFRHRRR